MPVRKQNISLPEDLADAVEREATATGVSFSAWLTEAARHQLRRQAGLAGVAEWEAEYGSIPDDLADTTDALVADLVAGRIAPAPKAPTVTLPAVIVDSLGRGRAPKKAAGRRVGKKASARKAATRRSSTA